MKDKFLVFSFPSDTFSSRMKLSPSRTLYVYNSLLGHFISSGPATFDKIWKGKEAAIIFEA